MPHVLAMICCYQSLYAPKQNAKMGQHFSNFVDIVAASVCWYMCEINFHSIIKIEMTKTNFGEPFFTWEAIC